MPLEALAQFPLVKQALAEFHRATGLAAKLVPAVLPTRLIRFGAQDSDFCRAVGCSARGCQACYLHQADLLGRLDRKLKPQQTSCLAGIIHLAIPVVVSGRHIATILGGKVRVAPANDAEFQAVARHLRRCGLGRELRELRRAYFSAPLLTRSQLRASGRLLDQLAKLFAETIVGRLAPGSSSDPPCVAEAKQFVRLHLGEHLTTRGAAQMLHLSESYFCRLFHRLTGLTFHAYVAQVRVGAAQAALANTHQPITEIALAAGFQSVTDFNRVFKASTGLTPTGFRRRHRVSPN